VAGGVFKIVKIPFNLVGKLIPDQIVEKKTLTKKTPIRIIPTKTTSSLKNATIRQTLESYYKEIPYKENRITNKPQNFQQIMVTGDGSQIYMTYHKDPRKLELHLEDREIVKSVNGKLTKLSILAQNLEFNRKVEIAPKFYSGFMGLYENHDKHTIFLIFFKTLRFIATYSGEHHVYEVVSVEAINSRTGKVDSSVGSFFNKVIFLLTF
jgi:hypothetical protein